MYGRLVLYTLQGGQRGPPSQPEARGVASGNWAPTRLFPSEAPMCSSALGSTKSTQQNNPTVHKQQQWTDIGKQISMYVRCTLFAQKCTVHHGAMCCSSLQWHSETAVWCSRVQYVYGAILRCNFQCNGVVHSAVDMARVYYLLNKVEWIGQAQAHALKTRLDKTHKQKNKWSYGRERC